MTTASGQQVIVHADADGVAEALAARLTARLVELQRDSRVPQVALTGGRVATTAYQRLAAEGAQSAVDWSQVELWWGDERFVASEDEDRNDYQVLKTLTEALPLAEERIHRMPASDQGLDLDAAAQAYEKELGDTVFDVCLLGMGPDGHVASLFPGHPSSSAPGRVIPVRDSPKPPPDRISLTLEVINSSVEVWFLVAGKDKADAAKLALTDGGDPPVPAARVAAVQRTVWLTDREAVSQMPPELLTEA